MQRLLGWRRRCAAIAACTMVSAALTAGPASADHQPRSYCSPNGDFCTQVLRDDGIRLRIGAFAFRGKYRLCVVAPDGDRSCKTFRLTDPENQGFYADSVRWQRHFPDAGPGEYRVIWRKGGDRLGRILGFHRGPPITCAPSSATKCAAPG